MRRHSTTMAFIGFLATTTLVQAQVPPATATTGAAAAQQAAPLAAGADVGFFGKCFQACEDCKRKLCSMPLGTMLNSMTQPFSAMSGGVIPNFCPTVPSAEDLAKSGVEGASAQAKKDAAEAKARRAAVRYLGTLDCRYYPEAEGALIAALRTDGVECVRWEAALVLGKGCCCSKKVIEALTHAVSCSEKDGNPAERSERVRFAACLALERCLACYSEPVETPEEDTKIKEKPVTPKEPSPEGDRRSSRTPDRATIQAARAAIKKLHSRYGLNTSRQINVVADEMVKLSPVPANTLPGSPVVVNSAVANSIAGNSVPASPGAMPVAPAAMPVAPVTMPPENKPAHSVTVPSGPVVPVVPVQGSTPMTAPVSASVPAALPAQPLKVINTTKGVMVIQPPSAPVQPQPVQTVAASTTPQNSVAVPGVVPGSTPAQKPAKRQPKTLFSLIRGNTNETTVPAQPFHHPMEQYQLPTNGLPPGNTTPGGR